MVRDVAMYDGATLLTNHISVIVSIKMLLPQSNDDLADGNIRLTIVMHRLAWGGGSGGILPSFFRH